MIKFTQKLLESISASITFLLTAPQINK